jgi:demethylmenaquinone methyltransferase/2-methoxy-6-polyprenyl-1,4-benzoquinol methylase
MQISQVRRSKSAAKKAYDQLSHSYDWLAGSSESKLMQLGLTLLAVQPGETILEVGSGTGKALVELCHYTGEAGTVHALDLSRGMLEQSTRRLKRAGLVHQISLLEGDGASLPYKGDSFNAVFICFTLELFDTPEIPQVLEECQRVLKPGGRLGVVAMLKGNPPGRIERLYEWFHEKLPDYVDCRPIEVNGMVQAAGFTIQEQQVKSMWGLPVELLVARKT